MKTNRLAALLSATMFALGVAVILPAQQKATEKPHKSGGKLVSQPAAGGGARTDTLYNQAGAVVWVKEFTGMTKGRLPTALTVKDAAGRLAYTEKYTYGAKGTRHAATQTFGPDGKLVAGIQISYDENGVRLNDAYFDAQGASIEKKEHTRLVSALEPK